LEGFEMKKAIVPTAPPPETRTAVREDKGRVEFLGEGGARPHHLGDIYKGRVNAVLPGMQAAFVEIGLPKTAFLHASDLATSALRLDDEDYEENGDEPSHGRGGRRGRRPIPKIEDYLEKGQEVLVQV